MLVQHDEPGNESMPRAVDDFGAAGRAQSVTCRDPRDATVLDEHGHVVLRGRTRAVDEAHVFDQHRCRLDRYELPHTGGEVF